MLSTLTRATAVITNSRTILIQILTVKSAQNPTTGSASSQTSITSNFLALCTFIKSYFYLSTYVTDWRTAQERLKVFLTEDVFLVVEGDFLFLVWNWKIVLELLVGNLKLGRKLIQIFSQVWTPPRHMSNVNIKTILPFHVQITAVIIIAQLQI